MSERDEILAIIQSAPRWIDDAGRAVYEAAWRFHVANTGVPIVTGGTAWGTTRRRTWDDIKCSTNLWCFYAAQALPLAGALTESLADLVTWAQRAAETLKETPQEQGFTRPFSALAEEAERMLAAGRKP